MKPAFVQTLLVSFMTTLAGLSYSQVNAAPRVVSSIQPLHMIAEDLMQGVGEPELLSGKNADPHHISLRFSERRMLNDADIVFWIGPQMEQPVADLEGQIDAVMLAAFDVPDVTVIDHDMHLWLSPGNGVALAEALASTLIQADPENAQRYTENLASLLMAVNKTEAALQLQLDQAHGGYAVYHNGFRYFEEYFGLQHELSLVDNEALKPGVQKLRMLQQLADDSAISCLLIEPDVNGSDIQVVTGKLELVTADPLGSGLGAEENRYAALLESTGKAFLACMKGEGDE